MPSKIDLNADVGEGIGDDSAIIPLVTSANIACGAHAGDEVTMRRCIEIATEHGVAIGAHPGHENRSNFGRVAISIDEAATHRLVLDQLQRLAVIAKESSASVRYVKPHGALYHQANADNAVARGIVNAITDFDGQTALLGQSGSRLAKLAAEAGVSYFAEGFADRAYEPDSTLTPRSEAGALLHGDRVVQQAVRLATAGEALTRGGATVAVPCDSLCLHGDTPGAVANARAVRAALEDAGVSLHAFSA